MQYPLGTTDIYWWCKITSLKWADVIPLRDQTANRITEELMKLFATYGQPEILHSDQGRNFESAILRQTLDAFGINKSCTRAYHPQGDGLVEQFNRSLLQLLRAYVDEQTNWEQYLPLVLYAYRTSVHSSTQMWPLLFSCLANCRNALTTLVQQLLTAIPIQPICVPSWFMHQSTRRPTTINNPVVGLSAHVTWYGCKGQQQASSTLNGKEIGVFNGSEEPLQCRDHSWAADQSGTCKSPSTSGAANNKHSSLIC